MFVVKTNINNEKFKAKKCSKKESVLVLFVSNFYF